MPHADMDYNLIYSRTRRCDSTNKYRIGPTFVTKEKLEHNDKTKPGKLKLQDNCGNRHKYGLIIYFWGFTNNQQFLSIDLNFIKEMLDYGVSINETDVFGQTVLHAIVRDWNPDVATFAIKYGADVNVQDEYGRTPLHLAAALNYIDVTRTLIANGADIELTTFSELQTPIHFAAKSNSIDVLQLLIKSQGQPISKDSNNRTALFLAAEKGCKDTADFLIKLGMPSAVFDLHGNSALAYLVENIPLVGYQALGQYIEPKNNSSHCFLYLAALEGIESNKSSESLAKSTLDVITSYSDINLIMHPVIKTSLSVKWDLFGRKDTIRKLVITIMYIVCWITVQFVFTSSHKDSGLSEYGWELTLEIIIIILTLYFAIKDYIHIKGSINQHTKWMTWKLKQIRAQYIYCHPAWPNERKKVLNEEEMMKSTKSFARRHTFWFVYECINTVILSAVIASRIALVLNGDNQQLYIVHHVLFSLNMGCAFIRVIKICLRFQYMAIFLKVASLAFTSFVQIVFLYIQFYVPFVAAFWLYFEEDFSNTHNNVQPPSNITLTPISDKAKAKDFLSSLSKYFYYVYTTSFEQEEMLRLEIIDKTGATILISIFHCFTTLLALSIIIAFITGRFAHNIKACIAEASLLRSSVVLQLERKLSKKDKLKLWRYYASSCSPLLVHNQSLPNEIHGRNAEKKLSTLLNQIEGVRQRLRTAENVFKRNKNSSRAFEAKSNYDHTFENCLKLNTEQNNYHKRLTKNMKERVEVAKKILDVIPKLVKNQVI